MTIPDSLKTLLVGCVSCAVNCPGIRLEPDCGMIPRGFGFGSGNIQDKDLAVIFPEPASNNKLGSRRGQSRSFFAVPGWKKRELFYASSCLRMGKRFTMHSSTGVIQGREGNEDQLL